MASKNLRGFRKAYLDYLEGVCSSPPSKEGLTDSEREAAEAFIESISAAQGVDPYASRPSVEQLITANTGRSNLVDDLAHELREELQASVDPDAAVVADAAAAVAGLASSLLVLARGLRVRVIIETQRNDIEAAFTERIESIAAVFGAYPDTSAILYTTISPDATGAILDRYDLTSAVEVPSGENRPPQIRRPILDRTDACTQWFREAVPDFSPLSSESLRVRSDDVEFVDSYRIAERVVPATAASGRRARIDAKQATWSALGQAEAELIAAIVDDALRDPLDESRYRNRLQSIVEVAA